MRRSCGMPSNSGGSLRLLRSTDGRAGPTQSRISRGPEAHMRIGIMGAGAIGSNVGGMLAKAGHDITLIDQWPAHVDAIKANGLRLGGSWGDIRVPVKALHLYEAQSIQDPFDNVFLAVKAYDTEWATMFILRFLR